MEGCKKKKKKNEEKRNLVVALAGSVKINLFSISAISKHSFGVVLFYFYTQNFFFPPRLWFSAQRVERGKAPGLV